MNIRKIISQMSLEDKIAFCTGAFSGLKHFATNSQEYKRMNGDSQMDERTLREIYLAAFETAVKEGHPATVMCAYNQINGEHCSDSKKLLTDILRTEWGFDGMVVTAWGALNDRIKGFRAGCDLNMPGGSDYMEQAAMEAVKNGTLLETDVDACVERILRLVEKAQAAKAAGESLKSRSRVLWQVRLWDENDTPGDCAITDKAARCAERRSLRFAKECGLIFPWESGKLYPSDMITSHKR